MRGNVSTRFATTSYGNETKETRSACIAMALHGHMLACVSIWSTEVCYGTKAKETQSACSAMALHGHMLA